MSRPAKNHLNQASRVAAVILGAAALGAALLVVRGVRAATTPAEAYVKARAPGEPLPILFPAPHFQLPDANGAQVSLETLQGKVWIANFIFTQCTSVCPKMTARMVQLQRSLRDGNVRFVSISVDPEHDTAEALRAYLKEWPADSRWLLLRPDAAQLTAIARGLRVAVAPSGDAREPILHSRLLTLVDAEGQVRGVYDSDDVIAWRRIAADATELTAKLPAAGVAKLATGGAPLSQFGCDGCHDRPELAPRLSGGIGRRVKLATGAFVTADDDYLRESILKPNAKVVAGYAPLMPSYAGALTDEEIAALIAAIRELPDNSSPPANPVSGGAAIDPICHMQVSTQDSRLSLEVQGRTYHFCSRRCLETFRARALRPHARDIQPPSAAWPALARSRSGAGT